MTTLETLVGMRILWEGEKIDWKIKPQESQARKLIEKWIHKLLKGRKINEH